MSTVDLMLLGALMDKSMNAYEMKKDMEARNIRSWVKISSPSIYKNLVILSRKGYLDDKMVKEGEMPEKTVYSINEKGRDYFLQMMEGYAEEPGKIYIDFAAFVANLHHVEPDIGFEMIKNLMSKLEEERERIRANMEEKKEAAAYYAISILELYDKMYALFCEWSQEIAHELAAKNGQ